MYVLHRPKTLGGCLFAAEAKTGVFFRSSKLFHDKILTTRGKEVKKNLEIV
jgi:hypothetical protein